MLIMLTIACIPTFNEEANIQQVIKKTKLFVDLVVICDDGSTDNTANLAEESNAYVIRHKTNLGKGAALKSLFKYAKDCDADVVVTIDGDNQFLPEEIPILAKDVIDGKSDIVLGYRYDTETEMPRYRKIGNKILDELSNLASELPFRDTQSGYRVYSKKAIQQINFKNNGFAADSEILINASKKDLTITEQKVTVIYNTGNKTSTKNPVSHAGEVATSLFELILVRHPLKFLGIPGILIIIGGIISSNYVISIFNETNYFSIPYTLLSIFLIILGIILILVSGILFRLNKTDRK